MSEREKFEAWRKSAGLQNMGASHSLYSLQAWQAAKSESAAEIAALRTELEEARKLLMLALYHHQGGGSPVGQPIRKFFGMDQFSRLTPTQMSEVESVAAIDAAKEQGK